LQGVWYVPPDESQPCVIVDRAGDFCYASGPEYRGGARSHPSRSKTPALKKASHGSGDEPNAWGRPKGSASLDAGRSQTRSGWCGGGFLGGSTAAGVWGHLAQVITFGPAGVA
jgi:hypothetical protein